MHDSLSRLAGALPLAALLAAPALARDVLIVDDTGGPDVDHAQIYEAVAVAAPGDTVLVRTGSYIGFAIDGLSLTVTAADGALVFVNGNVRVENLAPSDSVLLRGLRAQQITMNEGLSIRDCRGPVWVEDSRFFGPALPAAGGNFEAAVVTRSRHVSLQRCELTGARSIADSSPGGSALLSVDSRAFAFDSTLIGGVGSVSIAGVPFAAGSGVTVEGGLFYASGCTILGGDGGWQPFGCQDGGDGAAGLVLRGASPFAQLLGTTLAGGAAGPSTPPCVDGLAGPAQDIQSGSVLVQPQGARSIRSAGVVPAGGILSVSFAGEPGDIALLMISGSQRPVFFQGFQYDRFTVLGGPRLPAQRSLESVFVGRSGPNGLRADFPLPTAPAGTTLFTQALVYSAAREIVFSNGQAVTIVSP